MLVLTRKRGEAVVIGSNITITVVEAGGNRVKLGIDAPAEVPVLRGELSRWLEDPMIVDETPTPEGAGPGPGQRSREVPETEGPFLPEEREP
jgi:carbon storage regulator